MLNSYSPENLYADETGRLAPGSERGLSDPERTRIMVTVVGLIVSALLVAAGASQDPFVSYQNLVLVRSVYMSAAGIVFILSLLPWALTDSSAKPNAG
jgi:hypothetical protein